MNTKTLTEMVQELPPDAQEVVRDLVELLLSRLKPDSELIANQPLKQSWAGSLGAFKDDYSSLDLQHRAMDWRISL